MGSIMLDGTVSVRKAHSTIIPTVLALAVILIGLTGCGSGAGSPTKSTASSTPHAGSTTSTVTQGGSNKGSNNEWKGMFLGWGKTPTDLTDDPPGPGEDWTAWADAAMYLRYASANYTEFTLYGGGLDARIPAGKLVITENDSPDQSKLRVFVSSVTETLTDGSVVYTMYADDIHSIITCDGTEIQSPFFYYSTERGVLSVEEYKAMS